MVIRLKLVTPILALLSLGLIGWLQIVELNRLNANLSKPINQEAASAEEQQAQVYLRGLARFPRLGFDNLVANLSFLKFLQYFGDLDSRKYTGYALAPNFFEIIVERDPRFLETYSFLSASVSLYAGQPRKTVELLSQGLEKLSPQTHQSYYLWVYKATDELLFLGDSSAATKSNAMAIEWARVQDTPDSRRIAYLASQTNIFLSRNPDSRRAQVNAWSMVLNNAVDDKTRRYVLAQIQALGGQIKQTPDGNYTIFFPEKD
jgi:hypothetical protein